MTATSWGAKLPLAILLTRGGRETVGGIFTANVLVIAGVLLNRMSVCIFGLYRDQASRGASYFPTLLEFALTAGLIALAIFLFKMAAKHLPLLSSGAEIEH